MDGVWMAPVTALVMMTLREAAMGRSPRVGRIVRAGWISRVSRCCRRRRGLAVTLRAMSLAAKAAMFAMSSASISRPSEDWLW